MRETQIEDLITKLMSVCGLGTTKQPLSNVSGGFLHRMYRVETDYGLFAVKHLNTEIMKRPDAFKNYLRAESMEQILEREGIPIIPALSIQGRKMQEVEGNYFYLFHWQEGSITDWYHITGEQCRMAGNILGRIHAIHPEHIEHTEPELSNIDWTGYIQKAVEENSEILPILQENKELLIRAEQEMNRARLALPDLLCISDEDMDPKNIMWENGKPWVIDLECLDYGNPISHAFQLSLQWSGITTCSLSIQKVMAFFDGYLEAYDNYFRAYDEVFGLAYTWVEWLDYNIRRALGIQCMDEAEQKMGISEVNNTIGRLRYLHSMESEIKDALKNQLPLINKH